MQRPVHSSSIYKRQLGRSEPTCEWGRDISPPGPQTVRVHALPHWPPAKRSATNHEALLHNCEHTLLLLCPLCCPSGPSICRGSKDSTQKRRSTPHHRSIPPTAPGRLGLSRPLHSLPPPSCDHFSTHRPFCLMTAPNTKTSWISLLRRPLFLFTESPVRAFCTPEAVSPAAPTPSPHSMLPTPGQRHPCLTLHSTHSRFPFARLLLGGLGHNLILVPPPTKPPHTCALQRRAHSAPGVSSRPGPSRLPGFTSAPAAQPAAPKRLQGV